MRSVVIALLAVLAMVFPVAAQDWTVYLPAVGGLPPTPVCTAEQLADLNTRLATSPAIRAAAIPDPLNSSKNPLCRLPSETMEPDLVLGPPVAALPEQAYETRDWFANRKLNIYRLDCDTACSSLGMTAASASFSTRLASISSGSWQDHFFGQWIAVANRNATSTTCPGGASHRQHILMGVGHGRFSSSYYTLLSNRIWWNLFSGGNCLQNVITAVDVTPDNNVFLEMYNHQAGSGGNYWRGSAWIAGTWYEIFNAQFFHMGDPNYLMVGAETGAVSGNHAVFTVPMSAVEHIRIGQENSPWHLFNEVGYTTIPTALVGRTTLDTTSGGLRNVGYDGDNFTSIVSVKP